MRSAVEGVKDQVSNRVRTRSTSNQKKFMDDYANRRMTRAVFKQQQEQKGGEKPQEEKRKRKNKKKKPVVDDTPKISWGSRYVRYFTPEEREAYQKKLKESEGFDVGKYPFEVALSNPIRDISLEVPSFARDFSTEGAKMAIRDYNRKKRTKYQFVKLVRVCAGLCTGWMYYITFRAKQDGMAPSPPRNFQARVHNFMGMHVKFCREEKKPQLTEGYLKCSCDCLHVYSTTLLHLGYMYSRRTNLPDLMCCACPTSLLGKGIVVKDDSIQ